MQTTIKITIDMLTNNSVSILTQTFIEFEGEQLTIAVKTNNRISMNKKHKTPTASPLPFQGQKRMWIAKFSEVISEYTDNYTFVDLFGGSGLCRGKKGNI